MNFRPCPRLDNANVSYSFQDWQSFILFLFCFFFKIFDYALWFVYVVLAGTFIYSVLCEVFLSLKSLVISSSYSIQSRLKPGVTQGMLIFLFSFFFLFHFFLSFILRSLSARTLGRRSVYDRVLSWSSSCFLIVIVIYDCFFVDLVAWLFVGFFDLILVEAGRILISGYHIPGWGVFSLMCILYAVLMIEASVCFAFCFVFSLLLWVL